MNPRVIQMTVAAASMTIVGVSMDATTRHVIVSGAEHIVGIGHDGDDDARLGRGRPGDTADRRGWIGHGGGAGDFGGGTGGQRVAGAGDPDRGAPIGGDDDRNGRLGSGDRDGDRGIDAGRDEDGGIDGGAHEGVGGHGQLAGTGDGVAPGGDLTGLIGTDPGDANRDLGHGNASGAGNTGTGVTNTVDVPEPGMFGLLGAGLAGVAYARRRARARLARAASEAGPADPAA